jgi:putative ABC transport system ATP-binding protein
VKGALELASAHSGLGAVGLNHRLARYPAQLSGGKQQRFALTRALAPNPSIIVTGEVKGNLAESAGHGFIDLMFAQKCDRAIKLRSGRVEDSAPS